MKYKRSDSLARRARAAVVVSLCVATPAWAQIYVNNGVIGLYQLPSFSCCASTASGPATFHVMATLAGATAAGGAGFNGGITGAEFRIEISDPDGYTFSWAANSALFTVAVGNPLDQTPANPNDEHGINMAAAVCMPSDHIGIAGDRVELGTIQVVVTGPVSPCLLKVKRRNSPSNPLFDCPLFTLCDAPTFTKACLTAQPLFDAVHFVAALNTPDCEQRYCGYTGVQRRTWTGVKALFR